MDHRGYCHDAWPKSEPADFTSDCTDADNNTEFFDRQLIVEIKLHPCLYQTSTKKKREEARKVDEAWTTVAFVMDETGEVARLTNVLYRCS